LGCQWDLRQGDWSVEDQRLTESGNEDALVVARREVPNLSFYVAVSIPSVIADAKYRVIVNYVDDGNYQVVEFHFSTTTLTIGLYQRSSGANPDLVASDSWQVNWVDTAGQLIVCLSETVFLGRFEPGVSHDDLYATCKASPDLHANGYKAGLGNGGSVAIEYDDFSFYETGYTKEGCPKCYCKCPCDPLLDTLQLKIVSPDCSEIDGCTFEMLRQGFDEVWIADESSASCSIIGTIGATLVCDADAEGEGCYKYEFDLGWVVSQCPVTPADPKRPSQCTCEPFYLRFGGYEMNDDGCGFNCQTWPVSFYVEITAL
jgi:hypothetical protein